MGRLNANVNLRRRLEGRYPAFVVMSKGVPVGRVKLNPTHKHPQRLLEGIPPSH